MKDKFNRDIENLKKNQIENLEMKNSIIPKKKKKKHQKPKPELKASLIDWTKLKIKH
jgi:hypothetical protein